MVRIKRMKLKRSKIHVIYEFDHNDETHERTVKISHKDYPKFSKEKLLPFIRGQANRERAKLAIKKGKISGMSGIIMTTDEKNEE